MSEARASGHFCEISAGYLDMLMIKIKPARRKLTDEPTFPVLWAVPEGKAAAPWGKIIELIK
jgi:hypothetical protein